MGIQKHTLTDLRIQSHLVTKNNIKEMSLSMTLTEFFNKKYSERKDKDNIYGVGMSDAEFRHFIIEYLLPEGWCVTDPLGQSQINEIAIYEIQKRT